MNANTSKPVVLHEVSLGVTGESDIAEAVRRARRMAQALGLDKVQVHYVATAAAELAANLWFHGGGGRFEAHLHEDAQTRQRSLELATIDRGPGIADIGLALKEGYSTTGGLGCGLSGVQRLMDELKIETQPGQGTVVRARKWL
ncbi:MAG TPA: ATP-binding protein [Rhodocyclaceae bacterium]|nr:ATP-binding protein [Rhodocyclaceae bacterium]